MLPIIVHNIIAIDEKIQRWILYSKEMLKLPARITPITNKTGRKIFLSNLISNLVNEKTKFANNAPRSHGNGSIVKLLAYPPTHPIKILL